MQFIVDVNLPKFFSYFNQPGFVFASDIDLKMTDTEIWNLALQNNYVILTKDTDFYSKAMVSLKRPKIIYFNIGNFTLAELHNYFKQNWTQLQNLIAENSLIVANPESIDVLL